MIIRKQLKGVTFEYNSDSKELEIANKFHSAIVSKAQIFSLARFILRIAQKSKPRNVKKIK